MLEKLYRKNGVLFAAAWIVAYCVLASAADRASELLGTEKLVTLPALLLFSAGLYLFLRKNNLTETYGLCRSRVPAKKLLFYVPLAAIASVNLWFGAAWTDSLTESVLYALSMLCVGFAEEVIFRGLLYRAMCRRNKTAAMIVSSLTFGVGHLVNLFNGSGETAFSTLLQVCYAVAVGFLFVLLFERTGSLLACIATHGVLNLLSVFADRSALTPQREIMVSASLVVLAAGYAMYLILTDKQSRGG